MRSPVPPRHDPFAAREARKYERPIASREYLLMLLSQRGGPMAFDQIAQALELRDARDLEALQRRLNAMERDGQVIRNRRGGYGPLQKMDLVRGRVIGHRDGYGFLVPDGGGPDLFLSPHQMRGLMHGDRAVARVTGVDARGRKEGALVEVLERNTQEVVGRFFHEGRVGFVQPHNHRLQDVVVPPDQTRGARDGQFVVAQVTEQPSRRAQPVGRIAEVLGDHMAPGMEIDVAIRAYELPAQWPEAVQAEAERFGSGVPDSEVGRREDVRSLPLVTIDGADARDFDDAVYCEPTPSGWKLLVAIADVSWYVKPGTPLDQEAAARGNSVYFPARVVPMLPEVLSNGLCSLNPEEDRLCLACEMRVSREGKVTRSRFFEAAMRSHARLTYDEVAAMVVERRAKARRARPELVPHLDELHALYRALRKARCKRGSIDFETVETRILFGEDAKIERIEPVQRNDAHRMIEECMVAANVASARLLSKRKMPALYRVHEGPPADKLEDLRAFLGELGLRLGGGKEPEPRHYAALLERVAGRPDAHLIQTVLLRSLAQAVYSPVNTGHFGLALPCYTHFTSPIRRYPDLLVHRAIRHLVRGGAADDFAYDHEDMVPLGDHCSMTERRADDATRDAVDWLKCEFMLDKVGEVFTGIVSAVTSFGIFVELDDVYVEGLVHVSALGDDYFHFDPAHHRLQGERTRSMFRLADRVTVRVVRVSLDERKIDFELVAGRVRAGRRRARFPRTSHR
jgi:ribonuclease R